MDEHHKKRVVGGFIALIMVTSVFAVTLDYLFSSSSDLTYNDIVFRPGNSQLFTEIDGKERSFFFYPGDLEYIDFPANAKNLLNAQVLTVTYDPSSEFAPALATAQFYFEEQVQDIRIVERAVLNNSGLALEQKSCSSATSLQPVIELHISNSSRIIANDDCIKITGIDPSDLIQLTERIIYQILGVMK